MDESRDDARRRTLKGGRITIPHGGTINCVVRNPSKTGAALEIASPVGIPTKFSLTFDDGLGAVAPLGSTRARSPAERARRERYARSAIPERSALRGQAMKQAELISAAFWTE